MNDIETWIEGISDDIKNMAPWYVRVILRDRVKKQDYRAKVIKSIKLRRYNNLCRNTRDYYYEVPKYRFER